MRKSKKEFVLFNELAKRAGLALLFVMCFTACPQKPADNAKPGEISVSKVSLAGKGCTENGTVTVSAEQADLVIEFAEAYNSLTVKVNSVAASVTGKTAKYKLKGITEAGIDVTVIAEATGRNKKTFKFKAKKGGSTPPPPPPPLGDMSITSVNLGDNVCKENETVTVNADKADLVVEFAEAYNSLTVKVNSVSASVAGKKATYKLTGITETGIDVTIEAEATAKNKKTFKFKAKKGGSTPPPLSFPEITEVSFEGKNINPSAENEYEKDEKRYYASGKTPLLSEIAEDGSTKVGDTESFKLKVNIRFNSSTPRQEQKIKVENTTIGDSAESTESYFGRIYAELVLQKGDNNIVITYSEKDKQPLVYKVIVGYTEPEYKPFDSIVFNNKWYTQKNDQQKLEAGTETLSITGEPAVDVKLIMPEVWFREDGWTLTLDGESVQKESFSKTGWSAITYNFLKKLIFASGETKKIKIVFENTARNFKKEYSISVKHMQINKIKHIMLIDKKTSKYINTASTYQYKFDEEKKFYNTNAKFSAKDRSEKIILLVTPETETIIPKYAFTSSLSELSAISAWTPMTKKVIQYDFYGTSKTENTFALDDEPMEYGEKFFYVLLEKDGVQTYYVTKIERKKLPADHTKRESEEKIYKDSDGTVLEGMSPLTKKGIIRVLPESPRATVKLTKPAEKSFTLNPADDFYECEIDITDKTTPFAYKIIAENGTSEKQYTGSFIKREVLRQVSFGYEKKTNEWDYSHTREINGRVYIEFDQTQVKNDKIYLYLKTIKDLQIECPEFIEPEVTQGAMLDEYLCKIDVSGITNKKDITAELKLKGKSVGQLLLTLIPKDNIIDSVYVAYYTAFAVSNNEYLLSSNIEGSNRNVDISLNLLENETPENTNRLIKIFKGSEELTVDIDKTIKSFLSFKHRGMSIASNQTIILTIHYFADKNNTVSPTKTYTLTIQDI